MRRRIEILMVTQTVRIMVCFQRKPYTFPLHEANNLLHLCSISLLREVRQDNVSSPGLEADLRSSSIPCSGCLISRSIDCINCSKICCCMQRLLQTMRTTCLLCFPRLFSRRKHYPKNRCTFTVSNWTFQALASTLTI